MSYRNALKPQKSLLKIVSKTELNANNISVIMKSLVIALLSIKKQEANYQFLKSHLSFAIEKALS